MVTPAPLRVGAVQCEIHWNDVSANLELIESFVSKYASGVDLLIFPETITTGFSSEAAKLADEERGTTYQHLLSLAEQYQVSIMGSYLSRVGEQIQNLIFLIEPDGRVQRQAKRHLFAPGGEKDFVSPATERQIFSYRGWRILPVICYDLRFPVWCRNVANEYDILIAVANWPRPRREVFRTLLRARAMENLSYAIGVNRVGEDPQGLVYVGDSAILNARGQVLAEAQTEGMEVLVATLDYAPLADLRRKFPVWADADTFELTI